MTLESNSGNLWLPFFSAELSDFKSRSLFPKYAITNLAAIRMSDAERRYPRVIAWLGLLSCVFLAFWVDREIWIVGLALIAAGLIWWKIAETRLIDLL